MSASKILEVSGTAVPVPGNDIDTDRIIPARFLKEITFTNMGEYAFMDERIAPDGSKKDHPFNEDRFRAASILFVNKNFGCGSSREHAPQAIIRHGIRAIVGESFAEIFAGNCTMLGCPTAVVGEREIAELMRIARENPREKFTLDLVARKIRWSSGSFDAAFSEVVRKALTEGTWDSTGLMLDNREALRAAETRLPYLTNFA